MVGVNQWKVVFTLERDTTPLSPSYIKQKIITKMASKYNTTLMGHSMGFMGILK